MKKTNEEQLRTRKLKKPPYLIYNLLGNVWKMLFTKKYGMKVEYKTDPRKEKRNYLLISNHQSRFDYIFTAVPLLPKTHNFVVGYNEFYRSHLAGIFKLMKTIPKRNFYPDGYTIKEIMRIAKSGGNVMLYPEGMNSIRGCSQPVTVATGKLIKHLGIPVYYSVIKGAYLTCPKHRNDERHGTVEVMFDKLFEPEDYKDLSVEEIDAIINEKLWQDDFAWNKEKGYHYDMHGKAAEDLEDLLFICPKCGSQFTMHGEGNIIKCSHCGNGAEIDDTYTFHPLDDSCVIPDTQTDWTKMQRDIIRKEVEDENFSFSEKVQLGVLPQHELLKNQATSVIVGEGTLTIDRTGLSYNGTRDGKEYSFHINSKNLPTYGMCTDMSRFYTFASGEFTEFYPASRCVEKFFLATEEIHRLNGGAWQDAYKDK